MQPLKHIAIKATDAFNSFLPLSGRNMFVRRWNKLTYTTSESNCQTALRISERAQFLKHLMFILATSWQLTSCLTHWQQFCHKKTFCTINFLNVIQVKKMDSQIVTGLTHRRGILSQEQDGSYRNNSAAKNFILIIVDVLLEWAIYHFLWYFCGASVFLICNKDASV